MRIRLGELALPLTTVASALLCVALLLLPPEVSRLLWAGGGLTMLAFSLWSSGFPGRWFVLPALLPLGYALAVPQAASVGPAVEGVIYGAGLLGWWLGSRRLGSRGAWPLLAVAGAGAVSVAVAALLHAPGRAGEVLGYVDAWGLLWAAGAVACLQSRRLVPAGGVLAALAVASGSRGAALALAVGLGVAALLSPRRALWRAALSVFLGGLAGGVVSGPGWRLLAGCASGAGTAWLFSMLLSRVRAGKWVLAAAGGCVAALVLWCGACLSRPLALPPGGFVFSLPAGLSRIAVDATDPVSLSVERPVNFSTSREVAARASSGNGRVEVALPEGMGRFWTVSVWGERAGLVSLKGYDGSGDLVWSARLWPLKLLPGPLAGRLGKEDWSLWLRLNYARDCLRLWAKRPLLGWGYGGWASSYPSVQRFLYFTSDAHSPFLQAGAEGGLLGFAGYLSLWALGIAGWFKKRKEPGGAAALGALACLAGYGAFDVSLSLPVAVAAFVPLLASGSAGIGKGGEGEAGSGARRPLLPAACLVLCALAVAFAAGRVELAKAGELAGAGRPLDAVVHAERASRLAFLDAEAHAAVAAGDALLAPVDPARGEAAWRQYSLALALDRCDPELRQKAGWFLLRSGEFKESLALLEESVRLAPQRITGYEALASGYAYAGFVLAGQGRSGAEEMFEDAVAVAGRYESARRAQPEWISPQWRLPAGTSSLWLPVGESLVLLGRAQEARPYLERVLGDRQTAGPAAVFLAAGFPQEAEKWLSVAREHAPHADGLFEQACQAAAFLELKSEGVSP